MEKTANGTEHWPWQPVWAFVLALNLIVPLFFGWALTQGYARAGLVAAIGCFWIAGHYFCRRGRAAAYSLVVGGALFAVTQFFPFPQIVAGMIAVAIAQHFESLFFEAGDGLPNLTSAIGGFLATFVTGSILVSLALLIGAVIYSLTLKPGKPAADLREL